MAMIRVEALDKGPELWFMVEVEEEGSRTKHQVSLKKSLFEKLASAGEKPQDFVKRCFGFLLDREPKESILGEFDISVISRYFPEFEKTIKGS